MAERLPTGIDIGSATAKVAVWASGEDRPSALEPVPAPTWSDPDSGSIDISALSASMRRLIEAARELNGAQLPPQVFLAAPAHFVASRCARMVEAARVAGSERPRIASCPELTAIYYAAERAMADGLFLVYDLGAGFNVAVVEIRDGSAAVVTSHWDRTLGGRHFDRLLSDYFLDRLDGSGGDPGEIAPATLQQASERLRLWLDADHKSAAWLPVEGMPGGGMTLEITRTDFEALIEKSVAETLERVERVVRSAEDLLFSSVPDRLDAVIMAGGASRTPLVGARVEEWISSRTRIPPDVANEKPVMRAALGAALLAARRTQDHRPSWRKRSERGPADKPGPAAQPSSRVQHDRDRDEDTVMQFEFAAFHPQEVEVQTQQTLRAYAYLSKMQNEVFKEVQEQFDHVESLRPSRARESSPVDRSSDLTVVPDVPGLEFSPRQQMVGLRADKQYAQFTFTAPRDVAGRACSGGLLFMLGGIIIAEVPVGVLVRNVGADADFEEQFRRSVSSRPYGSVFVSYSREDREVVMRHEQHCLARGDNFLRDQVVLRSGQEWCSQLLELIDEADVFQLFWSPSAADSEYVRMEWEHALRRQRKRPGFIRPVYWHSSEGPVPDPPCELNHLHFTYAEL